MDTIKPAPPKPIISFPMERALDNRKVPEHLIRISAPWGIVIGVALVIRYVFDIFYAPADYTTRAALLSYALLVVYMAAAIRGAWRSGLVRDGVIVGVTAGILGGLVSMFGAAVLLAIWHDPATLQAWRSAGGLQEVFVNMPFDLFCIGIILGIPGGIFGKLLRLPFKRHPA